MAHIPFSPAPVARFFDEARMMHGHDWAGEFCDGWIITEKFNGVRAYWDGHTMWTRGGHQIDLPPAWRFVLPRGMQLDGELWAGYQPGALAEATAAARWNRFTDHIVFQVFDAPEMRGDFRDRMMAAGLALANPLRLVRGTRMLSLQHLADAYQSVACRGGEGLVLRDPCAPYRAGRTRSILKFKQPQYEALLAEFPHLIPGA